MSKLDILRKEIWKYGFKTVDLNFKMNGMKNKLNSVHTVLLVHCVQCACN